MTKQTSPSDPSSVNWYEQWFNRDYLKLYRHRNRQEATHQVESLMRLLSLSGRLLDLACGSGRHAIEFAKRGLSVVGVDRSPVLIDEANKEAKLCTELDLQFVVADMRHLSENELGHFDTVVSLFTSFGYFSDQDNAMVLKEIRKCLKPQGLFILDYLHPEQVKRALVPKEEKSIDGEKVIITRKIEGDQVIKTIQFPGRSYQEAVKLYTKENLITMVEAAEMDVNAVWNDFEGAKWSSKGERQVLVCQVS